MGLWAPRPGLLGDASSRTWHRPPPPSPLSALHREDPGGDRVCADCLPIREGFGKNHLIAGCADACEWDGVR